MPHVSEDGDTMLSFSITALSFLSLDLYPFSRDYNRLDATMLGNNGILPIVALKYKEGYL